MTKWFQRFGRFPGAGRRRKGLRQRRHDRLVGDEEREPRVTGKNSLELIVTDGGNGNAYDHADWAGARLSSSPDTQAPTVPTGLKSTAQTASSISLSWTASTDNVAVAGYNVYRNGALVGTSSTTTYTDSGLAASTGYSYTVAAFDAANNTSGQSTALPVSTTAKSSSTYVSDLTPTSATNGWGSFEKDTSNGEQAAGDGHTITLNGVTYAKGLGVHASSDLKYNLAGQYTTFTSDIGVDDEVANNGSVDFQVLVNGVKVFDSGVMTGSSATQTVSLSLAGANSLELIVSDGGNGNAYDHADWAGARLSSSPDTQAPTVPTGLKSTAQTASSISLSWTASTDNVAVAGYNVYRNGALVGTSSTTTYTDSGLAASTGYSYTVAAFDAANNTSGQSTALPVSTTAKSSSTYVSDLTPTSATNGWGSFEKDTSNGEQAAGDGHTITLNGVTYAKGLGVHASSDLKYNLAGQYTTFTSDIGVDDEVANNGSVDFQVLVNGVKVFDSGVMTGSSATQTVSLSLAGANSLELIVSDGGNGNAYDHADWAGATLS